MVKLPTGFQWRPAYYLMILNALVALAAAYFPGLNLTDTTTAAITTIATGVLGAVTIMKTRPVDIATLVAGLGTAAQAAAVFGLHLNANQVGTSTAVLSLLLAAIFHQTVTPVAAVRKGTTVADLTREALARASAPARAA
jgi:hypothetical protein